MATMIERRRATDEKIYHSALVEFGENGYSRTTLTKIAERAGITAGLIVQNFGSKEELFSKIARDTIDYIASDLIDDDPSWDHLAEKAVTNAIAMLESDQEMIHYMKFYLSILTSLDTPSVAILYARTVFFDSGIEGMIKAGQEKGELIAGDAFQIYTLFWMTMNHTVCQCFEHGLEYPSTSWFIDIIRKH